jgi:integrase
MTFQILTMTRPGEVRGTKKQEFDLEKRIWALPVERTKMRREHLVPLSDHALKITEDNWPEIEGVELLFPSLVSNRKWISENAFNSALRRLGYQKEEVTAHGFRAAASTILNSGGLDPEVIEAALAHQDIRRRKYKTREAARPDIFDYIEVFFNPKRKHARNGMQSPVDFENSQHSVNQEGV